MTVAGTCFGFQIESPQALRLLRGGVGTPLTVLESDNHRPLPESPPLMRWVPTPDNPLDATLFGGREPATYELLIEGDGVYRIDPPSGVITVSPTTDPLMREIRLLGLPLLLFFLQRGDLSLHGAAVEVEGGGIVLAAPGRHGKTSMAAGFIAAGHRLLAEDLSCIRPTEDPALIPGPACLRVRADMNDLIPLPGTEVMGLIDDRTLLAVSDRGTCDPVPLIGVVFLKDFSDQFRLERLDGHAALRDLWFLSLHLPNDEDRARKFAALADLTAAIPVWSLERPSGIEAIPDTVERLVAATCG